MPSSSNILERLRWKVALGLVIVAAGFAAQRRPVGCSGFRPGRSLELGLLPLRRGQRRRRSKPTSLRSSWGFSRSSRAPTRTTSKSLARAGASRARPTTTPTSPSTRRLARCSTLRDRSARPTSLALRDPFSTPTAGPAPTRRSAIRAAPTGSRIEGYYWRLTDAAAGRVVIVLCGVCRDAAGPWAIVALAAQPGGLVRSAHRAGGATPTRDGARGPGRRTSCAAAPSALRVDLGAGRPARRRASQEPRRVAARGRSAGSARRRSCPGCRSTGIRTCSARASRRGAAGGGDRRLAARRLRGEELGARASPSTGGGARPRASRTPTPAWRSRAGGSRSGRARRADRGGRARRGPRAAARAAARADDRGGRRRRAGGCAARSAAVGRRARGRGGGRAGGAAGARAGAARGRGPLAAVPGRAAARRRAAGAADAVRGGVGAGGARAVGVGGERQLRLGRRWVRAAAAGIEGGIGVDPNHWADCRTPAESPRGRPTHSLPSAVDVPHASARRTATVSGSAPTSRSNGPITVHSARSRTRAARRPAPRAPR